MLLFKLYQNHFKTQNLPSHDVSATEKAEFRGFGKSFQRAMEERTQQRRAEGESLFCVERATFEGYLECCCYEKCGLAINEGEICIGKRLPDDTIWFHVDCALVFKENIGSPTDLAGYHDLSAADRDELASSFFYGLPRWQANAGNIAGIAIEKRQVEWKCSSCDREFNASVSPHVYAVYVTDECGACFKIDTYWADSSRPSLSCDRSACRKEVAEKPLSRLPSSTEDKILTDCRKCGTHAAVASRCTRKEVPHTDTGRRRRLLDIMGITDNRRK
jgi:hypothetical protein